MECRDRKNHSAVLLPYSFLPTMASKSLRSAAERVIESCFFIWKMGSKLYIIAMNRAKRNMKNINPTNIDAYLWYFEIWVIFEV
jgi:hypothetical protein